MMYDHHKNNVYQVKYQDLTYGLLTTEDFKGDRPVQWVHAMDMKIESTSRRNTLPCSGNPKIKTHDGKFGRIYRSYI